MISEYLELAYFLIFSFGLSILLLIISFLITFDSKLDIEKSSAYECGFYPFSETRYRFEIQFYLIAILFLLFDIEILYLFPFGISLLYLSYSSFSILIVFFFLLFVGLIYEISRGVLNFRESLEGI